MKKTLISAMLVLGAGAAWAQQPDVAAARAALLAPAGHSVNLYCGGGSGKKPRPPFKAVVRERDGKLFVKFASCEKELMLNAIDDIKGEFCNGQAFNWIHRPGDPSKTFSGTSGNCTIELTPR